MIPLNEWIALEPETSLPLAADWLIGYAANFQQAPVDEQRQKLSLIFQTLQELQAFPAQWIEATLADQIADYAVKWRAKLLERPIFARQAVTTLDQIAYENDALLFTNANSSIIEMSPPERFWSRLIINLHVHHFDQHAKLLYQSIETKLSGVGSWVTGLCCGIELLIVANPAHTPSIDFHLSQRLIRIAAWCMHDPHRNIGSITALLARAMAVENPWVATLPALSSRPVPTPFGDTVTAPVAVDEAISEARAGSDNILTVHGSVVSVRHQGKVTFLVISHVDESGKRKSMQLIAQSAKLGQFYEYLVDSIRIYDKLLVSGLPILSRTQEPSLDIVAVQWLSANGLPSTASKKLFEQNAKVSAISTTLMAARSVLQAHGFLEVWTPTVTASFNGGESHPYVTYIRNQKRTGYLRVTMELAHKHILAQGVNRIYEIGSVFRNENRDRFHLPEFLMLEAYAILQDIDWIENVLVAIVRRVWQQFRTDDFPTVEKLTVHTAMLRFYGIDITSKTQDFSTLAEIVGFPIANAKDLARAVYHILNTDIARFLPGICILKGIPSEDNPFTKQTENARSWLYVLNMGLADICVEEVNVEAIASRLQAQIVDLTVNRDDTNLLHAIASGMPPTVGIGLSLCRLVQVLTNMQDIRELEWWMETI